MNNGLPQGVPTIVSIDDIPFSEYVDRVKAEERAGRAHWTALRRARLRQRSVRWANSKAIQAIYDEAARLSRETGVLHHVDHIIALHGANACGLHVEFNLQVLPAIENMQKGNR